LSQTKLTFFEKEKRKWSSEYAGMHSGTTAHSNNASGSRFTAQLNSNSAHKLIRSLSNSNTTFKIQRTQLDQRSEVICIHAIIMHLLPFTHDDDYNDDDDDDNDKLKQ